MTKPGAASHSGAGARGYARAGAGLRASTYGRRARFRHPARDGRGRAAAAPSPSAAGGLCGDERVPVGRGAAGSRGGSLVGGRTVDGTARSDPGVAAPPGLAGSRGTGGERSSPPWRDR